MAKKTKKTPTKSKKETVSMESIFGSALETPTAAGRGGGAKKTDEKREQNIENVLESLPGPVADTVRSWLKAERPLPLYSEDGSGAVNRFVAIVEATQTEAAAEAGIEPVEVYRGMQADFEHWLKANGAPLITRPRKG